MTTITWREREMSASDCTRSYNVEIIEGVQSTKIKIKTKN